MSTEPSRTAVSTVAAERATGEVAQAVTFQQLERMAASVAKSGLFAVKTPEAALTLMLVAQSEGTHPVTAMMEYDIIEGKPSLKSSAMLTRFLRAGGKVEWHAQSNDSVSGTFTSPRGNAITVTWDAERVKRAGLEGRPNHQKFPMQMKRARCIAEGIRAVWPVTQLYTPEELSDVPDSIDITPTATATRVDDAVTATAGPNALSEEDRDAHFNSIGGAPDLEKLKGAFSAAWKHASEAKDHAAGTAFKQVYESRKTELGAVI
jgi:hypothetical protein